MRIEVQSFVKYALVNGTKSKSKSQILDQELLPLPVILTAGCLESDGNKKVLRRNHIGLQSTWPRVLEPITFECKTLIELESRSIYIVGTCGILCLPGE